MTKSFYILVLTFIVAPMAFGDSLVLNREKFVHLSLKEKKDVVKKTMELVVSLEARYKFSPVKRDKKVTTLLHDVKNFLVSDAHAQASRAQWSTHLTNLSSILNKSNSCLYAGWVSQIRNGLCVHPSTLGRTSSEFRAYQAESSCVGPNQISCNPVIFGFKSSRDKSLFCVPAGLENENAHNSSLRCMKKALAEPNEGDAKEERLEYLAQMMSENPQLSTQVLEFISKACLCNTRPEQLNENYHAYMRPHQTCYGLMNIVAESTRLCQDEPILGSENTRILADLQSSIVQDSSNGNDYGAFYASFLTNLSSSRSLEMLALCPQDLQVSPPRVGSAGPAGVVAGEEILSPIPATEVSPLATILPNLSAINGSQGSSAPEVGSTPSSIDPITGQPLPPLETAIGHSPTSAIVGGPLGPVDSIPSELNVGPSVSPIERIEGSPLPPVENRAPGSQTAFEDVSTTVTTTTTTTTPGPGLMVSEGGTPAPGTGGGTPAPGTGGTPTPNQGPEEILEPIEPIAPLQDLDARVPALSAPELTRDDAPTLELKITGSEVDHKDVEAIVTPKEGANFPATEIIWTRKGAKDLDLLLPGEKVAERSSRPRLDSEGPADSASIESRVIAREGTDSADPSPTTPEGAEDTTQPPRPWIDGLRELSVDKSSGEEGPFLLDVKEWEATRSTKKYTVCAHLRFKDTKKVIESKCGEVAAKPRTQAAPGMQMPQGPTRGTANGSYRGIR